MAFTLQDDEGSVDGANAYIDEAFFVTYMTDRGEDVSDFDTPTIEAAIVRATDYLDTRFRFVGEKLRGHTQNTQWPRLGAYDFDRSYVNGVAQVVKEATAEYAFRALSAAINPDPTYDATGTQVKSKAEAVGPISEEVSYVDGAPVALPKYPAADSKMTRSGLTHRGGEIRRS